MTIFFNSAQQKTHIYHLILSNCIEKNSWRSLQITLTSIAIGAGRRGVLRQCLNATTELLVFFTCSSQFWKHVHCLNSVFYFVLRKGTHRHCKSLQLYQWQGRLQLFVFCTAELITNYSSAKSLLYNKQINLQGGDRRRCCQGTSPSAVCIQAWHFDISVVFVVFAVIF